MASKINYSTHFSIVGLFSPVSPESRTVGICAWMSPLSRFLYASKLSNWFESGHLLTIWNYFIFSLPKGKKEKKQKERKRKDKKRERKKGKMEGREDRREGGRKKRDKW